MNNIYRCEFDGSCFPENPGGNMGIGVVIYKNSDKIYEDAKFCGKNGGRSSSNLAEYLALEHALLYLKTLNLDNEIIEIYGDSRLVINQLNNIFGISTTKIYSTKAREVYILFRQLVDRNKVKAIWIPREKNKRADELSKEAHTKFT